jgi:hypothetical protein
MSKPTTKTSDTQTSPRPLSKAASVFDDDDDTHIAVLCPRAVARVTAALQAIETLSGLLLQRHEADQFEDNAPEVDHLDTRGILNAISICSMFTYDHLNGGSATSHYTLALEKDKPGFDQITRLTREARDLQKTTRDKRRLEIVEGQSC